MPQKSVILLCLALSGLVFLAGCWDRRPVDELGILMNLSVDLGDTPGSIRLYAIRPVLEQEKDEFSSIRSAIGDSIQAAIYQLQRREKNRLVVGQMHSVFISRRMAEAQGIDAVLDQLDHLYGFESLAVLAILEGDTANLLEFESPQQKRTSLLLHKNLEGLQNREYIPASQFFRVMITRSLEGQEIVLPRVELDLDEGSLVLNGLALFNQGDMKGTLSIIESTLLLLLKGGVNETPIIIPKEIVQQFGYQAISADVRKSSVKMRHEIKAGKPFFHIDLDIVIDINDVQIIKKDNGEEDRGITDPENVGRIEEAMKTYLDVETGKLLEKLTRLDCDALGFGEKLRVQDPAYFKQVNWREVFPESKFTTEAEVKVHRLGIIK